MIIRALFVVAAFLATTVALPQAQAWLAQSAPSGSGYTGPCDAASVCSSAWGLVAATASYASSGGSAFEVSCGGTDYTIDFLSTGAPDYAAQSSDCGDNTPYLLTFYDQIGSNNIITTIGTSTAAVLSSSCGTTGKYGGYWSSGDEDYTSSSTITQAQPLTMAVVMDRTTNVTSTQAAIGNREIGSPFIQFADSANTIAIWDGTNYPNFTADDNELHILQAVINGGSSIVAIDGTNNTGVSLDDTADFSGDPLNIGSIGGQFYGCFAFGYFAASAVSTANLTAIYDNLSGQGY